MQVSNFRRPTLSPIFYIAHTNIPILIIAYTLMRKRPTKKNRLKSLGKLKREKCK